MMAQFAHQSELNRLTKRVAALEAGKPANGRAACSFCGKDQDSVALIIQGPTSFICDECIVLCVRILVEKLRARNQPGAAA